MAEDLYPSPGLYGVPIATKPATKANYANYMLNMVLTPSTYKWKIEGIDVRWRESYEGKRLPRDYYTMTYSNNPPEIIGTLEYYLDSDVIINVVCEEI